MPFAPPPPAKGCPTVDSKTNSLIVTDTQEGLKEVEDLIPVLDRKPAQVDIETKIVEVTLNNSLNTGISWNYAATGNNNKVAVGGTQGAQPAPQGSGCGNGRLARLPQIQTVGPGNTSGVPGTGVNFNSITQDGFSFLSRQGTYLLSAQIAARWPSVPRQSTFHPAYRDHQ